MKATILGLVRKSGEYQGHAYDNMYVHAAYRDPDIIGTKVEVFKVKMPVWSAAMSDADLLADSDAIGASIDFNFGRYDRLESVEITPKPAE